MAGGRAPIGCRSQRDQSGPICEYDVELVGVVRMANRSMPLRNADVAEFSPWDRLSGRSGLVD
jgi:hypothetical protein